MKIADDTMLRQFLGATVLACLSRAARAERVLEATPSAGPWQIGCYTRPWDRFDYRVRLTASPRRAFVTWAS